MSGQVTLKELHTILGDLIECGHGDKEFQIYYDSETVYTTIPKGSRILVFGKGIRFSDYEIKDPSEEGAIGWLLEKLERFGELDDESNDRIAKENQKLKNEISQLQAYNSACEDTLLNVDVTLHQMITKAGNEHDKKFKAAKIHNSSSDIKDIEKTSMLLDTVFYWEGYLKALKDLKNEIFPKDVQK